MRKWGLVVTVIYAAIVLGVLTPVFVFVVLAQRTVSELQGGLKETYSQWIFWVFAVALIASEATLLFLSVDTSHKRLKPRSHILVSGAVTALLIALLTFCVFWSLGFAIRGDNFMERLASKQVYVLALWAALWVAWSGVFYLYLRNASVPVTRLTSWLLKGSVLELLVAVPCHVIVRRRGDCSAPLGTSFGMATGIAIMLLSFGPGVLLLYKKRLDAYSDRTPVAPDLRARAAKGKGAGSEGVS